MSSVPYLRLFVSLVLFCTAGASSAFSQSNPPRFFKRAAPYYVPRHEKLAQVYRQRVATQAGATPIERQLNQLPPDSQVNQASYEQTNASGASSVSFTGGESDQGGIVHLDENVMPASCDCGACGGMVEPSCGTIGGCGVGGCGAASPCSGCAPCGCAQSMLEHLSIFGGVQGFKGPANRGQGGSFGFHEGLNWGAPLPYFDRYGWAGQVGFRATQSELSGSSFSNETRNQWFLTTGVFRRADFGLQGGVVFDFLSDDWYYDVDVAQLRGELSFALSPLNSIGFWFATNTGDDTQVSNLLTGSITESWATYDLYALKYTGKVSPFSPGVATIMAGFTDQSDGFIHFSSDIALPFNWSIVPAFSYVAADERRGGGANIEEAWNVGISLEWKPWASSCGGCSNYNRPLFDVADNGTMIIHER